MWWRKGSWGRRLHGPISPQVRATSQFQDKSGFKGFHFGFCILGHGRRAFWTAKLSRLVFFFTFLEVPPGHAIVDPGASQDLIGLKSYQRLCEKLKEFGLKTVRLEGEPA